MKQLRTIAAFLLLVLPICLISCGGSETTSETATDIDTTAVLDRDTGMAQSHIITTPENIVVVRYRVSNYSKWREMYDARDSMRTANGLRNYVLGRGVKDSNEIIVAVKASDMAKAKALSRDPKMLSEMKKGYVTGTPKYYFISIVYQDMSPGLPDLRSMTFFPVKDWNTWKSSFESSRQLREQNGVKDRAYGHVVDDSSKVLLVVAITDTAKANAFWNSDTIKVRRAEAGVIGEVQKFDYRVVQKY